MPPSTTNTHIHTHAPYAAVQIHVVDASGTTDREGQLVDTDAAAAAEQQEQQAAAGDKKPTARGGDPLDDVG